MNAAENEGTKKSLKIALKKRNTSEITQGSLNSMSTKESTKSKFEQLLKAALEDAKTDKPVKKKKKQKRNNTDDNQWISKKTHDNENILEEETECNDANVNYLDTEGVINPVFLMESCNSTTRLPNEEVRDLNTKASSGISGRLSGEKKSNPELVPVKEAISLQPIVRSSADKEQETGDGTILSSHDNDYSNSSSYSETKRRPKKKHKNKFKDSDGSALITDKEELNDRQEKEELLPSGSKAVISSSTLAKHTQRKNVDNNGSTRVSHSLDLTTEKSEHGTVTKDKTVMKNKKLHTASPTAVSHDLQVESEKSECGTLTEDKTVVKKKSSPKAEKELGDECMTNTQPDSKILSVKIHRVDRLKLNLRIKHPLVRLHIVDGSTGMCIKKQVREKAVTLVYENRSSTLDYILPIMTQPYDLKQKGSTIPVWEEVLLVNESFEYFIKEDTILFFEILDFLPMSVASNQYARLGGKSGWYHIAWSFLKLVGANSALNTGSKVQLQLYCPPKEHYRPAPHVIEVFHWWSSLPRIPYPGTLYVTVSGAVVSTNMAPALRSLAPMQEEKSVNTSKPVLLDINSTVDNDSVPKNSTSAHDQSVLHWSRLPGQSCKVPNHLILKLPTAKKGCFTCAFSHSGRSIACGCYDGIFSTIKIYEIPSGELLRQLDGHTGLIYELQFEIADQKLISAAADGTTRVWCLEQLGNAPIVILPHPSFVYTSQFHPLIPFLIVTGCYDTVIRVWSVHSETGSDGELIQELEGHEGYVNSLCFDKDGTKLYSGDHKGVIRIWNVYVTLHPAHKGVTDNWSLYQEICNPELKGIPISKLGLHPTMKRILIQSQDGVIRLIDAESFDVIQCFKGYLNVYEFIRGCVTPCGSYIFTGSEDHYVYVWNTVTGTQAAIYSDLPHSHVVHGTNFHPHDHIVAFCSSGMDSPVLLYRFNHHVSGLGVNHVQPMETITHKESLSSFISSPKKDHKASLDFSIPTRRNVTFTASDTRSSCLEQIVKKLDSVLDISYGASVANTLSTCDISPGGLEVGRTSWGSTFDSLGLNPDAVTIQKAIVTFDYGAQRSDELTLRQGETLNILHKESENWFVGRLPNGETGYIPTNYILLVDNHMTGSSEQDFNLLNVNEKHKDVMAVIDKAGQLMFISASEDESPIPSSTPKRHLRRLKKRREKESSTFEQP